MGIDQFFELGITRQRQILNSLPASWRDWLAGEIQNSIPYRNPVYDDYPTDIRFDRYVQLLARGYRLTEDGGSIKLAAIKHYRNTFGSNLAEAHKYLNFRIEDEQTNMMCQKGESLGDILFDALAERDGFTKR